MSGEAIYRGYDRAALDAQYNNRARIPEYVDYFDRWLAWSAETRAALPGGRDIAYGDLPVETLDIFPAERHDAPILIMIHGGYWYSLDKHHDSFVAEGCRPTASPPSSSTTASPPTTAWTRSCVRTAPQRPGSGATPLRSAAIRGAFTRSDSRQAATSPPCCWRPTGRPSAAGLPADLVKSAVSISGIYDLEPIRLCYLNDKVGMDEAEARRNSPVAQRYPVAAPLMLVSGDIESDEYERQADAMEAVWEKHGYPLSRLELPGFNHFTMADQLREARQRSDAGDDGADGRAVVNLSPS